MEEMNNAYDWARELSCGVTVCDKEGVIIFINNTAAATFSKYGDNLVGHNLSEFHPSRAMEMINKMLLDGSSNSYTIEKQGVKKLIHQMAWFDNGEVAGLVELSMVIPFDMPHYVRK